nr:EscN/YscN/HrcN family type III secretion system ATPase [Actinomycetota bacterium]
MKVFAEAARSRLVQAVAPKAWGRVTRLVGLRIEVDGVSAAVGDALRIYRAGGVLDAEVVAVEGSSLACMPLGDLTGVRYGDRVEAAGGPLSVMVGPGLLGRVLDGLGRPIDGRPLDGEWEEVGVDGAPPHPLRRDLVDRQLGLGVKALDTMIPCGRGQRLGIFAGSGVGKSSLLSMITRGTNASVAVLAL